MKWMAWGSPGASLSPRDYRHHRIEGAMIRLHQFERARRLQERGVSIPASTHGYGCSRCAPSSAILDSMLSRFKCRPTTGHRRMAHANHTA